MLDGLILLAFADDVVIHPTVRHNVCQQRYTNDGHWKCAGKPKLKSGDLFDRDLVTPPHARMPDHERQAVPDDGGRPKQ